MSSPSPPIADLIDGLLHQLARHGTATVICTLGRVLGQLGDPISAGQLAVIGRQIRLRQAGAADNLPPDLGCC